jgi:hypothetical protein
MRFYQELRRVFEIVESTRECDDKIEKNFADAAEASETGRRARPA